MQKQKHDRLWQVAWNTLKPKLKSFIGLISLDTHKINIKHTDTHKTVSSNQQHFLQVQTGIGASNTQKLPNRRPGILGLGTA